MVGLVLFFNKEFVNLYKQLISLCMPALGSWLLEIKAIRPSWTGHIWFVPHLASPNDGKKWLANILAKESLAHT
jgi:hypothetical protein